MTYRSATAFWVILLFVLPQTVSAQSVAKIKGTITYYFNANYGTKADTGAKIALAAGKLSIQPDDVVVIDVDPEIYDAGYIYVHDAEPKPPESAKLEQLQAEIMNPGAAKNARGLQEEMQQTITAVQKRVSAEEAARKSQAAADKLRVAETGKLLDFPSRIKAKKVGAATADGNGNYEIPNVPAGEYTLVIQTSHAKGKPAHIVHLIVKDGEVVDQSYDFGTATY